MGCPILSGCSPDAHESQCLTTNSKLQKDLDADHLWPELHSFTRSQATKRCKEQGGYSCEWSWCWRFRTLGIWGNLWGGYVMGICHVRQSKSTPKSTSFVPAVQGRKCFSFVQQLLCPQKDPGRTTHPFVAMYGRNIPDCREVCASCYVDCHCSMFKE